MPKARGIKYANVFDDLFSFNAGRIAPLGSELGCPIRADVVTEEELTLLANLGVKNIAFGAESGSNRGCSYW